jgi:hypothetical protein
MTEKAVIDRFEEDLAVILVGEEEEQFTLPREALPEGAQEGSWLQIERREETIVVLSLDEDETERVRSRIAEKMARLRRGDHRSVHREE